MSSVANVHALAIKNEANQNLATLVRATSQSSQMPEMRLTDYLAARFGRLRPS